MPHGHVPPHALKAMRVGVLGAQGLYVSADYAAGIRAIEIDIQWSQWQQSSGTFTDGPSVSYQALALSVINAYVAAGFDVCVNAGVESPPSWVLSLTNGQLIDQYGVASGTANYWFASAVRTAAATYLANLVSQLAGKVHSYRIGLGPSGESWMPPNNNSWWAFDATAQAAAPTPGWIPGTASGIYLGYVATIGSVLTAPTAPGVLSYATADANFQITDLTLQPSTAYAPTMAITSSGGYDCVAAIFTAALSGTLALGYKPVNHWSNVFGAEPCALAVVPVTSGDLMYLTTYAQTTTNNVSTVAGGGVATWTFISRKVDATTGFTTEQWWGKVTTPGSANVTVTYTGAGIGAGAEVTCQEITSSQGASTAWTVQSSNTSSGASVTTATMPSLTSPATTTVTTTQVNAWFTWYASVNSSTHNWAIAAFRTAGWSGPLQFVLTGYGCVPSYRTSRINAYLVPDGSSQMNIASAWDLVIPAMTDSANNLTLDNSGLFDGSGTPANNYPASGDQSLSVAAADPGVSAWSAPRWIYYLCVKYGIPMQQAESIGGQGVGNQAGVFNQAQACGVRTLYWANDVSLNSGGGTYASLSQIASLIAQIPVSGHAAVTYA